MAETLKACPFCCGPAAFERSYSGGPYVLCGQCGAATMFAETTEDAARLWNTRPEAGWQGISDEAKDGRNWLALGGVWHGLPFVVQWQPRSSADSMPWYCPLSASRLYEHVVTHVQPLPTPPTESPSK